MEGTKKEKQSLLRAAKRDRPEPYSMLLFTSCVVMTVYLSMLVVSLTCLYGDPPKDVWAGKRGGTCWAPLPGTAALVTVTWLLMFFTMWANPEVRACAVKHVSAETCIDEVTSWKAAVPKVVMWVKCYHEAKFHRHGQGHEGNKAYTHEAMKAVFYASHKDVSHEFVPPDRPTIVSFKTEVAYEDDAARVDIEGQYLRFLKRNEKDVFQDQGVQVRLHGFKPAMLVIPNVSSCVLPSAFAFYAVATLLGILPVCHHVVMTNIAKTDFVLVKSLAVSPVPTAPPRRSLRSQAPASPLANPILPIRAEDNSALDVL
eukprot:TRINITY_DN9858_c0_g3_i1.p1 TRINITY_DN9858_c0_g3~~TRINITY_DN9858_c0_g3_i1.p1  ORF type:complete len:328 (+),score=52.01 TRINITY_DN9858_c0_g3_i1:43-984(+)